MARRVRGILLLVVEERERLQGGEDAGEPLLFAGRRLGVRDPARDPAPGRVEGPDQVLAVALRDRDAAEGEEAGEEVGTPADDGPILRRVDAFPAGRLVGGGGPVGIEQSGGQRMGGGGELLRPGPAGAGVESTASIRA